MGEDTRLEAAEPTLTPPKHPFPWGQMLLGLLILICGMIIGACCVVLFAKGRIPGTGNRSPRDFAPLISQQLSGQLDLTQEQRQQVREIVEERMGNMHELRTDMRIEFEEMGEDIEEVLTDEQRQQWQEHIRRLRALTPPNWQQPPGQRERSQGWPRGRDNGQGRGRERGVRPQSQPGPPQPTPKAPQEKTDTKF